MAWPDWPWPPYFTTDLFYATALPENISQLNKHVVFLWAGASENEATNRRRRIPVFLENSHTDWCVCGAHSCSEHEAYRDCSTNNLYPWLQVLLTDARLTRNSAIADKSARRVYRSVKVTKHSTIPYARYSFLLCNCNCLLRYSTSKMSWPWIGSEVTQGHWRWHNSIDCVWFPISVL